MSGYYISIFEVLWHQGDNLTGCLWGGRESSSWSYSLLKANAVEGIHMNTLFQQHWSNNKKFHDFLVVLQLLQFTEYLVEITLYMWMVSPGQIWWRCPLCVFVVMQRNLEQPHNFPRRSRKNCTGKNIWLSRIKSIVLRENPIWRNVGYNPLIFLSYLDTKLQRRHK